MGGGRMTRVMGHIDVPDFYATEPVPGEGVDPDGTTRRDACIHARACLFCTQAAYEMCGVAWASLVAEEDVTDGRRCAECGLYEPREGCE